MPPASNSITTFTPDKLFAGHLPIASKKRTLLSGDGARTRGAVLGRTATAATVAAAAAAAGNTGNGTVTLGGTPFGGRAKEGTYKIIFIEPAANLGTFEVEAPDGTIEGRGVVGTQYSGGIVFTVNDGATDFISGDLFTIAVSAVTFKYKRSVAAAVDGTEVPVGILADDADSTAADVECLVYERGDFNENVLNFGAGHTAGTVRELLRQRGINLVAAQAS